MQGNTNAVIGKGGGSGATVTAINKTGSTITTGQKVWLNENAQMADSSYKFAGVNEQNYLSRSGNFAYANGKTYSITNESATSVGSISAGSGEITYMADNSVFANYGRVDGVSQYSLPITNYHFGDDYFGFDGKFNKINMTDGSVIQSWTLGSGATYTVQSETCKVGNYFYRLSHNSTYSIKVTLNDDGTATGVRYNFSYVDTNSRYPIGVTVDNKYIIADSVSSNLGSSGYLRIIEVIDEDNFKELPQSEMPTELQKYFSTAKGYFVFNPYTGILTAVDSTSIDYVVMKYENGEWKTIPVTLALPEDITSFTSGLVVSDDLSRASISYKATQYGSYAYSHIHNLTTTQGYAAVPYRFYNVTENTITGYAGNDTEADGEVIVGIGSVPSVDNGGTGGGNYDPTTPPLEEVTFNDSYIDTDKIVSVGRVFNTDKGEPTSVDLANLTENSGFTQYSNSLFNSEDKSLANEFYLRFHLSDRVGDEFMKNQFVYLFGHNTASDGGNWWDETDRSDQFSIVFGFDSEWVYKTVGVNTGFVDENGWHSPNTRVDIGGELQFGWNTIKMYYNNDIQSWVLGFGDNFSMEYSIPELPKVCKPYNIISLVENAGYGDNCVDLAETGFKLNGEWVWRAVK